MHSARIHRARFMVALTAALLGVFATSIAAEAVDLGPTNQYIITVDDSNRVETISALRGAGAVIDDTYENALEGFLVEIPDALASSLRLIPHVLSVEVNRPIALFVDQQNQTPTPSWGLDRIDQVAPVSTAAGYVSNFGYRSAGAGTTIYIGDTGIYPHEDLAGRISSVGFAGFSDGNGTVDCNGHGTHVSTTAAGTKYGVAKNATVVPVRILNCAGSGSYATVIAGLDWILSDANTNSKNQAVVSLSLGGPGSVALNNAIAKLTNAGIVVVVAAGNSSADACGFSPASAPSAITVGATTSSDTWAGFSNYGSCVDISAPGVSITGGWKGSSSATNTINGTSMATPHVSGAVAVYRGLNPGASVDQVTAAITGQATVGAITGMPANTVNKLLYISPSDGAPLAVAPTVQVKAISSITSSSASIDVDVNPGSSATTATLEISTDATFAADVKTITLTQTPITGSDVITLNSSVDSLTANSTYYVRAKATSTDGTVTSAVLNFKTTSMVVTPTLVPNDPQMVTGYSARLTGTATANSPASINIAFQYGTDPNFVNNTVTGLASPQSVYGNTVTNIALDISNLLGSTQYYYRIVAGDSGAQFYSDTKTFTTPAITGFPPIVITNKPTVAFSYPDETVTGTINPQGQQTHVVLVYGLESSLTVGQKVVDLGSNFNGYDTVTVSANIPSLIPGKGYYFRFEASNNSGITRPNPIYAITSPIMPVVLNTYSSSLTQTGLTLNAQINAGASNTRIYFIYGTDPKLETGTVIAQGTPFAIANAVTTVSQLALTGLLPGTTIYYRVKIQAYTGPLMDKGGVMYGPITTGYTLAPTRLSQTINFTLPTSRFFGGPATVLTATASSGLPVTYVTTTPSVCSISSVESTTVLNYVTPVSAALYSICNVVASQPGDSMYSAASSVSRNITFNKELVRLTSQWATAGDGQLIKTAVTSASQPTLNENVGGTNVLRYTSMTPKVCSIVSTNFVGEGGIHSQALIKPLWNGTCTLQVAFDGNSYWLSLATTYSYVISGITTPQPGASAPQTINFGSLASKEYGVAVPLVATSTSGLPVTFSTTTPSICVISSPTAGTYVAQAADGVSGDGKTCMITASQAGNDRWAAATSVARSFVWLRKLQTITFTMPLTRYYGGAGSVISASSSAGLPITFSSSTPLVCAVTTQDGVTVVNYVSPIPTSQTSSCVVKATAAGDGYYMSTTSSRVMSWMKEFTSIKATWPTSISINGSNVDFAISSASQPLLGEQIAGTSPLVITSSTPNVCQVVGSTYLGESGVHTRSTVRALWNGTCTLKASFAGNSYWLASTSTVTKTITGITTPQPGANAPQTIAFNNQTNVPFETVKNLTATTTSALPATFATSTPAVCTVTQGSNGAWTVQSVAGLTGDNNTCSVTASQAGNDLWAPAPSITRTFKFIRKVQSITFTMPTTRYFGGAPTSLVATSSSGLPVTLTTTTPSVCQIQTTDAGNLLTYVTPIFAANSASCVVVASQPGNDTFSAAVNLSRSMTWIKESTVIRSTLSAPISVSGTTVDFYVTSNTQPALKEVIGGDAAMTVVSKTPKVCDISDVQYVGSSTSHTRATLKALWNGTCQLQLNFAGTSYWLASQYVMSYSISGITTPQPGAYASQYISFAQPNATEIGTSVNLVASANSNMPVTVTSQTPAVCSVVPNNTGFYAVVAASGLSGDNNLCSITASQDGDTRWAAAASVTRTFAFNRPTTGINAYMPSVTSLGSATYLVKAGLVYGSPVLNNAAPAGMAIPVAMTTSTPAVCSVGNISLVAVTGGTQSHATINALANGTCTITATYAGDGNRKPAIRTFSMFFSGKK